MKVTIHGPGCARCHKSAEVVRQVMEARGLRFELEKVTNYALIAAAGGLATPGIALDDHLVSSGKVPSTAKVESWLA